MNSKVVGDSSVAKIMTKLITEFGCRVSIPFGDNCRYDLIVDTGDRLIRVQCKTATLRNGCLHYNDTSVTTRNGKSVSVPYTTAEIDAFMVYSPDLDKIYSIPVGVKRIDLRVVPPKNGQHEKIHFAVEYELKTMGA